MDELPQERAADAKELGGLVYGEKVRIHDAYSHYGSKMQPPAQNKTGRPERGDRLFARLVKIS